ELEMLADDLVVVGAGRLLAAEPLAAIVARSAVSVVLETPDADQLVDLLATRGLAIERTGHRLVIHGTTTHEVSQIAFDNRIRVIELGETTESLEDSLLAMTSASA